MKVKSTQQQPDNLCVSDPPMRLSNISGKASFPRIALLSCLLALLTVADARKTFFVKQQHPALYAPKVQAYDTSIKLFDI